MTKKTTLEETIKQYPSEFLLLLGNFYLSNIEGATIMHLMKEGKVYTGSDGSGKDVIGGHAYCITDNTFNKII